MAGGAQVGALRVTLGLNTASYEAGIKRAQAQTKGMAANIQRSLGGIKAGFAGMTAGLLGVGAITGLVQIAKRGLETAAALGETAQQLGVTTEALQVFRYAATQAGMTQEEMDTSLKKLSNSISEAGQGSKAQATAFNELGVNVQLVGGKLKSTDQIIREMADGFVKLKNPQDQVRLGMDLMGRSGSKMVPMLTAGAKGVDALTQEAKKLGLVLSDEQIQNADKTADKLEQLYNQLSTNIAGAVANNATAIGDLATGFAGLVVEIIQAIEWLRRFDAASPRMRVDKTGVHFLPSRDSGPVGVGELGTSVSGNLGPIQPFRPAGAAGLNRIAGGGGGRKGPRGKSAEQLAEEAARKQAEALQRAYELDRELGDSKADILRAEQDLLTDYVERQDISHKLIDIEVDQYNKQLDLDISIAKLDGTYSEQLQTATDQLRINNERKRVLEKQLVNQQVELDRQQDFNAIEETRFSLQREQLDLQAALAETAAERRMIELQILELAYRERKERLERIIAESRNWREIQQAQMELAALPAQRAGATAGVLQSTRGPLEQYQAGLPTTAAKMNEALQNVAVDGLRALEDGILSVIDGTKSLGAAFRDMASQIIADLLRIQIQRAIIGPASDFLSKLLGLGTAAAGASGGGGWSPMPFMGVGNVLPFATGGYTGNMPTNRIAGFAHGQEYVFDANATRRIGVGNLERLRQGVAMPARGRDRRAGDVHFHLSGPMSQHQARETVAHISSAARQRLGNNAKRGLAG